MITRSAACRAMPGTTPVLLARCHQLSTRGCGAAFMRRWARAQGLQFAVAEWLDKLAADEPAASLGGSGVDHPHQDGQGGLAGFFRHFNDESRANCDRASQPNGDAAPRGFSDLGPATRLVVVVEQVKCSQAARIANPGPPVVVRATIKAVRGACKLRC